MPGTLAHFDLDGAHDTPETFFDSPFPSNLRLHPDGRPDLTGYPNPRRNEVVSGLRAIADQRVGAPQMPVAYFRFDSAVTPAVPTDVIAADLSENLLLIELEPDSPGRGELTPLVAHSLVPEQWAPGHVLAIAPRPGFVLRGATRYAAIVKRGYNDATGQPLGVPGAIRDLIAGERPAGARGQDALELYAPLWPLLAELGVDANDVAAATVFTTGDQVSALSALSDAVLERDDVAIAGVALDPDDGSDHERYCELHAEVEYAQYQPGQPPFDTGGIFEIADDGLPVVQRMERAPIVLAIPKTEMPSSGFPLMLYFHGSGGLAAAVVDAGPASVVGGPLAKGLGPAHVVAEHGIASAGSALPLSPDRVPGLSDIAYLNFNNLAAFRDTFRQGVIEQRIFLRELGELRIDPAALAGCTGPSLPNGATEFFFDTAKIVASGQSMGGMYTNLVTPLEPTISAAVPTGAGGMWNKMILETALVEDVAGFVALIVGTTADKNSFLHPGMHLIALAWETAEPLVFMGKLARDPLPGFPVRPTYEPVGQDDIFFPTSIFDAAAVSYGHEQAGDEVWPEMQTALALAGRGGVATYPVANNLVSSNGESYTGVVVQYAPDGIRDGHYIYAQLDEVKYQYGCFLATFLANGVATVPAPAPSGTACPGL